MEDLQAYYGQDQEEDRLLARFVASGSRARGLAARFESDPNALALSPDLLAVGVVQ